MTNVNTDSELILEAVADERFALTSSIERFLPAKLSSADLADIQEARQAIGAVEKDAHDVSKSLYLLTNGVGKQRATVNGRVMLHHHWRVAILSNGEDSIEAHLSKAGIPVKAGELVRSLKIFT